MTASQRREQLLDVSRQLFAEKGFEGTSVEEIAARAQVSKPVVYEHFGGKEGIYAVVVDRETTALTQALIGALERGGHPQLLVERTALALLDYIESSTDGFRMIGERCASIEVPTAIVQEGGYLCYALGDNLAAFLRGFREAAAI